MLFGIAGAAVARTGKDEGCFGQCSGPSAFGITSGHENHRHVETPSRRQRWG